MRPIEPTPEMLIPSKEGEPTFLEVVARMTRLNRISGINCAPEPMVALTARLYAEYKDRDELAALAW